MKRCSVSAIRGALALTCVLALPALPRTANAWCAAMGGYASFEEQARAEAAEARRRRAEAAAARRAALEERRQQKEQTKADQTALKRAGYYKGAVNGQSGSALRTAIKEFREANGLGPESTLDTSAREVLNGGAAVPRKNCDDPQEELKNDQQALADLGFFKGAVDGCPAPATRAAIRKFNEKHGFASNGAALDDKARAALRDAQAKAASN